MKYFVALIWLFGVVPACVNAQAKIRKLSTSINHPSLNLYSPFISADGNTLAFISDNAEDNVLTPFFTFREGPDWKEPVMFPRNIHTRLNFLRGFVLSADGKKLWTSTVKSPGVGGYDIWSSEWKGNSWSEPVNPGLPINTKAHEVCGSLTPDGNVMYFMRCEKMDQNKAAGCKVFRVLRRSNGEWDEPAALPPNINTGNSQTPRIMADGETLIFSTDQLPGNQGGMDLYWTRSRADGSWSDPRQLDFVNTPADDQYVSASAVGRYLLRDSPGPKKNEIVEYLFPDDLRPWTMMKLEGKVSDPAGVPVSSYITVFDLNTGKQYFSTRPGADGSFMFYLKEGARYEVSIDPEQGSTGYFSRIFDLTTDKIPQSEKLSAVLKKPDSGDEISLDLVAFREYSSDLNMKSSSSELKRFLRLIKGNPDKKFQVQVLLNGYQEDSVQSHPDLTEVYYDSIETQYEEIDSLGQVFYADTVVVEATFHNDRTEKQAQQILEFLISAGVDRSRLSYFVNAIPAGTAEEKKLKVRAVVQ